MPPLYAAHPPSETRGWFLHVKGGKMVIFVAFYPAVTASSMLLLGFGSPWGKKWVKIQQIQTTSECYLSLSLSVCLLYFIFLVITFFFLSLAWLLVLTHSSCALSSAQWHFIADRRWYFIIPPSWYKHRLIAFYFGELRRLTGGYFVGLHCEFMEEGEECLTSDDTGL